MAAAAAGLLAWVPPVGAQAADLAGAWHGVIRNLAVNIAIAPDMQFTESYVMNGVQTNVKGHIVPFSPGVVTFVVDEWAPRSTPVDKSVTYEETWVSPNEVVLTDANQHGSITLRRVS